jgi:phage-related protein (TIGR01555 family)
VGEFNMSKKRSRSKRASDSTTQPTKTIIPSVVTPKFQPHSSAAINSYVKDGFANFASRLGVNPGTDNQISEGFYILNLLTRNRLQLEAAYRGSWIVGAMVDAVAEDMTKAGIDVTTSEGAKNIQDFQAGMKRLQIWSSLCDVIKWSRLYGGAIGVLQIEGQDLSSPLRIETVAKGQFLGLAVYDRWQLFPDLTRVIPSGPDMGLPAYYTILTSADYITQQSVGESNNFNPNTGLSGGQKVHHSRIIRMGGVKLPFYQAITEQMWGMSELERIHDRLVSFDTATMSSCES